MSPAAKVPARLAWAVELLDVEPGDHVLEFGFGPGVSVELMAARLDGGRITAIDRSASAVERAGPRLRDQLATGQVTLQQVDLAGFAGEPDQFDKALGVNINVFWTGQADDELAVLARVLRPGGVVWLVYEGPPGGAVRAAVAPAVTANLQRHGFAPEVVPGPTPALLAIAGRRT
jgi:cyclopropane fatty-acyl-phospholipid synthase-like methyltransferase